MAPAPSSRVARRARPAKRPAVVFDRDTVCVLPSAAIRDAMARLDRNQRGIVLVVDEGQRLLNTITDGDIRRAILAGIDLEQPVTVLQQRRAASPLPLPVTAPAGTGRAALLRLMKEHGVRQMPLLDAERRVVGLVTVRELLPEESLPLQAVVMAGGYGTRMRPLTETVPKPMLPVGEKPLLELIVGQLREAGIRHVHLTGHYKKEMIASHFGDGRQFGVDICYVDEAQPLGTAGALSLLKTSAEPLLVMNGDILTRVDFRAMLDFHREHAADMTVAVRAHEVQVPYGVVEADGARVIGVSEKPRVRHMINCGIYLLDPEMCRYVPSGQPFDMPDLITRLLGEGRCVVSFPVREYWLDIGRAEHYQQALDDVAQQKF